MLAYLHSDLFFMFSKGHHYCHHDKNKLKISGGFFFLFLFQLSFENVTVGDDTGSQVCNWVIPSLRELPGFVLQNFDIVNSHKHIYVQMSLAVRYITYICQRHLSFLAVVW